MKKNFLLNYAIVLVIVCISFILIFNYEKKNIKNEENDAIKFQTEYMSLNEQKNSKDLIYPSVSIDSNNLYYYANPEEIDSILNDKTGIIYFGFPTCPWCRNIVSILNDVVGNYGYNKIYYYNIKEIRSSFSFDEQNNLIKQDGTDFYDRLLNKLDNFLEDYKIKDQNGKKVFTGEKRLYAPTVVFVKEGKVLGIVVGTVESQKDPYILLNEEEKELLSKKYQVYLDEMSLTCDEKC